MSTVYAHIARDGAVLYIGRTSNLEKRNKQHQGKPWWADVVEVRVLHADITHAQSVRLEQDEIEAHDPPYNVQFTRAWREAREHGYALYTHGCRCAECRAAKAAYIRERRRAARELAATGAERHYVSGVKHATSYAYFERGCRCSECTQWMNHAARERERRRNRQAA